MIDQDGEQAGIVSIQQALDMAEQAALDLVEISPNAEPPVCRIMNYGKFLYEKSKTAKEQKKKQKAEKGADIMTVRMKSSQLKRQKKNTNFITLPKKIKATNN